MGSTARSVALNGDDCSCSCSAGAGGARCHCFLLLLCHMSVLESLYFIFAADNPDLVRSATPNCVQLCAGGFEG